MSMLSNIKQAITPVPLLDLKAQYEPIAAEIQAALNEVCESQYFILGPKVQELEENISDYSKCQHGVGVSSGSDALLLALMTLDVGLGDEVITTPYTFFATAGCIARVGARPIFCDIDPITYNLDPQAVRATIAAQCEMSNDGLINKATGGRVKAMIPVHLYGQMADMEALMVIAKEYNLLVVEDAAQAIGAEDNQGRRAGSIGDIGCLSFFPSKNLGAFGDGGMCTSNDAELDQRMRILRAHGSRPKYYHALIGGNFRLDALHAAVLSVKLPYLDGWTAARQDNARRYNELFTASPIATQIATPRETTGYRHIYNQYVVRVPRRDELRSYLAGHKIGNEVYYPVPLHLQKCFDYLGYQEGSCPESERAAAETIAVPIYPELTETQQRSVVNAFVAFYQ
ncbi:MAG: DegT/DnrJ/EryC1/StrS family aminotransferase [Gammaproteobacteria bacterium]